MVGSDEQREEAWQMTADLDDTPGGALARVELAEAEAVEAATRADAAKARAQAVRLRYALETSNQPDSVDSTGIEAALDADAEVHEDAENTVTPKRRNRLRRPGGRTVATVGAALVFVGLMTACGFMVWSSHAQHQERERATQFAAAARQGVVNMTTLDSNAAERDVAQVLDGATGEFREDFAKRVDDMTAVVRDSKVVTSGTVNATAVESMTKDSAVVLVAATSTVTDAAGKKEEPRNWRLSVTVSKDGDQLKLAKVEFIP